MVDGFKNLRSAALAVAGGLLSALLLMLLFRTLPFDAESYRAVLANARWTGLAGIVAATVLHCWITGVKWRYVTRLTSHSTDLGLGYYLYSALIGLLGQVLPLQVAMLAGRSLALRAHAKVPLRRGAGGVVFDQFFDLLIPMTMLVPIILAATSVVSVSAGAALALGAVALAGALLVGVGGRAVLRTIRAVVLLAPKRWKGVGALQSLEQRAPQLLARRTLATLYGLSTLRVANLVFRAWLVAWTLHLDLSWAVVLFANCGVTFSLIFAFAPGALGVVEWGWVGMLHLFGMGPTEATQYALSSRLFAVAALILINLAHGILLVAYWGIKRARNVQPRMDTYPHE